MKSILSIVTLLFCLIASAQKEPVKVAKGYQVEIKTSAICEMCQHAIEYDLAFEKGIKTADLNLDDKVVTVVYNPDKTSAEKIRKRITMVGYHADSLVRDPIAYEKLPNCCKDGAHADDHKDDH